MANSIQGRSFWSSRFAFILVTAGAAIGLGNIWKFPYIAGMNGGGAFVLVYLLCVLILGIPIMIAEVTIGRRGGGNPVASMTALAKESSRSRYWGYLGGLFILAGFLILTYYSVIAGWALDYVFKAAVGSFHLQTAPAIDKLFSQLIASPNQMIFWHTIMVVATVLVVGLGINRGIERTVFLLFPAMIVLLLMLIAYSIDIGYFTHGIEFLFKPDFAKLTPHKILIALGHAFFTLSLAAGSIMAYGAYLPDDISIGSTCFYIALADTLIALVAGLAIYPLVFAHGLAAAAGPGLIFKTLPLAFGHIAYGTLFATLFFLMLVFAAFTSAISLLEPTVAWLIERFQWSRKFAAVFSGFFIWLIGLGTVYSFNHGEHIKLFGLTFFDFLDYLTSNLMLPLGGLLIAIFAGWVVHKRFTAAEIRAQKPLYFKLWLFTIRFVVPIAIVLTMLNVLHLI